LCLSFYRIDDEASCAAIYNRYIRRKKRAILKIMLQKKKKKLNAHFV